MNNQEESRLNDNYINNWRKIKSRYILKQIFDHLNPKIFLNIIKNNKNIKNKLDIDLNDYKYVYLTNKFNINRYKKLDYNKTNFDKDHLYKKAKKILELKSLNFSINDIIDIVNKNCKKAIKEKKNKESNINPFFYYNYNDIYSPFNPFIFDNNDYIGIPLNYIIKYNLKNDYILFFEKNKKSQLCITYDKRKQIELLKELKIDFLKVKSLYFKYENDYFYEKKYNFIFTDNFLFKYLPNNLEILCLDFLNKLEINNNIFNS